MAGQRSQIGKGYWSKKDLICFTMKDKNGKKKIVCFPASRGSSLGSHRKKSSNTNSMRTPTNLSSHRPSPPSAPRRLPAAKTAIATPTGRPKGSGKRKQMTPRRIITSANTRIRDLSVPLKTSKKVRRIQTTFLGPATAKHGAVQGGYKTLVIGNIPKSTPALPGGQAHAKVQSFVRDKIKRFKASRNKKTWTRDWNDLAHALGFRGFKTGPKKSK